jgi:GNAT superfamily N-acetyltransferase
VSDIHFRRATVHDVERLARLVTDGLEDYPSFAPTGWTAPSFEQEIVHLRESLAREGVYCLVAESGRELVGQITVLPAAAAAHPVGDPTLAHLSNLFVRRGLWGSGLARDLQRAAIDFALQAGFEELRLFVAAGQTRARRFYEREGWVAASDEFFDPGPGLTMVEYRFRFGKQ